MADITPEEVADLPEDFFYSPPYTTCRQCGGTRLSLEPIAPSPMYAGTIGTIATEFSLWACDDCNDSVAVGLARHCPFTGRVFWKTEFEKELEQMHLDIPFYPRPYVGWRVLYDSNIVAIFEAEKGYLSTNPRENFQTRAEALLMGVGRATAENHYLGIERPFLINGMAVEFLDIAKELGIMPEEQ
jgi:hypothetical protein